MTNNDNYLNPFFKENTFCQRCGLHLKQPNGCLQGRGNLSSKVLVLADSPTLGDVQANTAFSGGYGASIERYLLSVGIEDCYMSYVTRCHYTEKKYARCKKHCNPFTVSLIRKMKPKVIIALGANVLESLTHVSVNMDVVHGKPFYHREYNLYIIPTFSPISLAAAEDGVYKEWFIEDLKKAKDALGFPSQRIIEPTIKSLTNPVEIEAYLNKLISSQAFAFDIETAVKDIVDESEVKDTIESHSDTVESTDETSDDQSDENDDDEDFKPKKKKSKFLRKSHNPRKDIITDISFCCEVGVGIHIKWDYLMDFLPLLKDVFSSPAKKIGHNARYDQTFLECVGIHINNVDFDTMIDFHALTMSYEGGKAAGFYKLKTMAWILTHFGGYEEVLAEFGGIVGFQAKKKPAKKSKNKSVIISAELSDKDIRNAEWVRMYPFAQRLIAFQNHLDECDDYIPSIKKKRIESMGLAPNEYYAGMDSVVTFLIYNKLKVLIEDRCGWLHNNILMPLNQVFTGMELVGIRLDVPYMQKLGEEYKALADEAKNNFYSFIGKEVNIASPKQLQEVVFKQLGVKPNKKYATKTGNGLNEIALTEYATQVPELKYILDYRGYLKLNSTYIDGFIDTIDPFDNRTHPSWMQIATATGRASAKNPPVQTIPRGDKLRQMVIPADGRVFVMADLSQAELRFMAMVSGDETMIAAFNSGVDFHTATACKLLGIRPDQYDDKNPAHKEARNKAKIVNFGIIYLKGPKTLANDLSVSVQEASDFLSNWFKTYPKVYQWIEDTKRFAISHGYVETLYGRRRYLPLVRSKQDFIREAALRQACNTPIQSGANDITCMALCKMHKYTRDNNIDSRIVMVVHDEIVCEPAIDVAEHIKDKLKEFMTCDVYKIGDRIPLIADAHIDSKWSK